MMILPWRMLSRVTRLSPSRADRVGFAPHADVGQHLMGIGDRYRVGADVWRMISQMVASDSLLMLRK